MMAKFISWWNSDWGPAPLIKVALPLMISAAFFSFTLFADRTMLYWQSEASASAAMGAGVLYWSIICLPMGMLGYIGTFVSQYRGADRLDRIGAVYQHAHAMAIAFIPALVLFMLLSRKIFEWSDHSPNLIQFETTYLRYLLVGGLGVLFYSVQSGLLIGSQRTKTVLALDGLSALLNIILDVVLIFGFGPIPALGVLGAALATAISFWIKVPIAAWIIRKDYRYKHEYKIGVKTPWEKDIFRRFLVFGTPVGLQMLAEAGCFSIVLMNVGSLGELPMAATTLALGLNVIAFVPMAGLGIGLGVLVGERLTAGNLALARRAVSCAMGMTLAYTGFFALLFLFVPNTLIAIYAWGTPASRFQEIEPLLLPLLKIIAFYCIADGLQVVYIGAIKGAGDTQFVLFATFLISLGAVLIGLLCQSIYGPSLMLWWYVIAGWIAAMGLVFATRYYSGRWEKKRVIEAA